MKATINLGGELIIHDRELGNIHVLNETGSVIWEALKSGQSQDEITTRICAEYTNIEYADALADVIKIVSEFARLNLDPRGRELGDT
jgi:hypothetical protein